MIDEPGDSGGRQLAKEPGLTSHTLAPEVLEGRTLCVFSSSSDDIDDRYLQLAANLGSELARRHIDLVSGGGSVSMMGAMAVAARAGGSRTVGVIPRALIEWEVADDDADELVVTSDMRERKGAMDALSDGFLALPGGLGTLEELLEAWVGRLLGMHRKPVVILDPWGDFSPLRTMIGTMIHSRLVRARAASEVIWVTEIAAALDAIEASWDAGEGRGAKHTGRPTGHPEEWLEAD